MRNLATKVKPQPEGRLPVLVLDNHPSHKGADRLEIIRTFAKPEYIPAYSCEVSCFIHLSLCLAQCTNRAHLGHFEEKMPCKIHEAVTTEEKQQSEVHSNCERRNIVN